jgi:hypothetical protein
MHKTTAGERRKALKGEAMDLEREARALARIKQMEPAVRSRQEAAERLKAEAEALKGAARIEDLHVWELEKTKTTKKGNRSYRYWMATWREGSKTRNVHLGSCRKMDAQAALQKAKTMKTEALGIKP